MAIHDFHQSFNAGELSPDMDSRVAVEKYASGCLVLENFLPRPHGPIRKRPGFVYLAAQHAATSYAARLVGFNFSGGAYGLFEFASGSLKVWTSGTASVGPYGVVWTYGQLAAVKFAHINNVIYAAHPDVPVNRITRDSASAYTVTSDFAWTYPALLDENVTTTTLACSAATAGTGRTLTASAAYFTSANVGSYFEISHPRTSSYVDVTMGDDATKASVLMTIQAACLEGETFTIGTRVYTFRTAGRDAVDEIDVGEDADSMADNILAAIGTGGGGADPHKDVEVEEVGGLKAVAYLGNTANTNFADDETVTIADVIYSFDNVGTWQEDPYVVRLGATLLESLTNLMKAINRTPRNPDSPEYWDTPTDETLEHPTVEAVAVTATGTGTGYKLQVRAKEQGAGGNSIAVTETATASAWYSDAALSSASSVLAGGTRVLRLRARLAGTGGNSIASTETVASATALAFSAATLTGGADDSSATSSEIIALGKYEVRSTGLWKGTVTLQKERTTGVWETLRIWNSNYDYNILETLEAVKRTNLRLVFSGSGDAIDGVFPRVSLTPADAFVRGLVKVTAYTSTTQVTVTVINDLLATTATPTWAEGAWSPRRGYPRALCFHQNRMWYAGTAYDPSKLWASALGDFENFRITSLDDGAMSFQIAASEAVEIMWLAVSQSLIIGTTRGIWVADAVDGQSAFTNTSPPIFRQRGGAGMGCADFQPVLMQDSLAYVQRSCCGVRQVTYDGAQGFSSALLTVLADHVTGSGVGNLAAMATPDSILWAVNSDYELIGLTLDREQNVFAWHRHPMAGSVESVAVVTGSSGDELWISVSRNSLRVIERMDVATLHGTATAAGVVHVDGAVKQTGSSFSVITGLTHLNGLGVTVWLPSLRTVPAVSGTTQPVYTVSGGQIDMVSFLVDSATAGLPFTSQVTTMRPEVPMRDGSAQGRTFKVCGVTPKVRSSADYLLICEGDSYSASGVTTEKAVVADPAGSALESKPLKTARIRSRHRSDGIVSLKHIAAGPLNLTGLTIQLDVGGAATNNPPGE
jgi:hypothetical protein